MRAGGRMVRNGKACQRVERARRMGLAHDRLVVLWNMWVYPLFLYQGMMYRMGKGGDKRGWGWEGRGKFGWDTGEGTVT